MTADRSSGGWVLLSYRIPREPSSGRISIWRKLDRLGVARLGDGLVALPADAHTRERMDWIADEIAELGGHATVWMASPTEEGQTGEIAATMRAARAAEYRTVIAEATAAGGAGRTERIRAVRRLRDELRRIARRDFFPPVERDSARSAVQNLAEGCDDTTVDGRVDSARDSA